MARIGYIPHNQDREDQIAEERAERRAMRKEIIDLPDTGLARFAGVDPEDPDFASVENFVEFCFDDDRCEFTHGEMHALNVRTGLPVPVIKGLLIGYGLRLKPRPFEKTVRGITSNPNAGRFDGMHGGGGGTSIMGIAGYAG